MKKICRKFIAILLVFAIVLSPIKANAAVSITQANLQSSAATYLNYIINANNANLFESCPSKYSTCKIINITVDSSKIAITFSNNDVIDLNYRIDGNTVQFYVEKTITNGTMTEAAYQELDEYLTTVVYGYAMVAQIEGASYDKSLKYFQDSFTYGYYNNPGKGLLIVPDGSSTASDDPTTIKVTETDFKNNTAEWISRVISNDSTTWYIQDNLLQGMLGSYYYTRTYADKTDNSIKLRSHLVVDVTKNYSNMNAASDVTANALDQIQNNNGGNGENNNNGNGENGQSGNGAGSLSGDTSTTQDTNAQTATTTEKKTEENPKTGVALPVAIMVVGTALAVVIAMVTKKKKKLMKI